MSRTRLLRLALPGLLLSVVAGLLCCCALSSPRYRGPASDHFDGARFHNQTPQPHRGVGDLLRWRLRRALGPWRDQILEPPGPPPPRRVEGAGLRVTFINHATTLIQTAGLNVLTDPIWSERSSPVSWAGPQRHREPGLRLSDLPPIDVILISHNHYDHLDLPTLRTLAAAHHPRIFAGLGNRALLERAGIPGSVELDWWQEARLPGGVRLLGVPAQHMSQRGPSDRDVTLWLGFVLDGPGGRVYFAGDTGFGPHFAEIGRRLGPLRLALLPIGAYRPRWFMIPMHIDPAEAVRAHALLGAQTSVAIHFGTFALADDGESEPVEDLAKAVALTRPTPRFWVLGFGEGRDVP